MRTGSLRDRVLLTSLPLLAAVLVAVVAAVSLIYRDSLHRDLRHRLTAAAIGVQHAWPQESKQLLAGLALEGIAADIRTGPRQAPPGKAERAGLSPIKPGSSITSHGSLLVLDQTLPDGTRISYSASQAPISHSVRRLLTIEVAVALAALALAALLLLRGATTALRPLAEVAETARQIAAGERSRRLQPDRDDTELGRMAAAFDQMVDALETAIARAETAEASIRNFLADASHELRTPIAALQATAETLLREQPKRPERDQIEATLARDTTRLGRLVSDLLTLTRLEAANRPDPPVDLTEIAAEAIADATRQTNSATITLTQSQPCPITADPEAITRLLRNLLDNALSAGATKITIQTKQEDGVCALTVQDNGSGIPHPDRERIFQRFTRLNQTRPGNGLGLAIARHIAHQHRGQLTCEPATNGARFLLRIPQAEHTAQPPLAVNT